VTRGSLCPVDAGPELGDVEMELEDARDSSFSSCFVRIASRSLRVRLRLGESHRFFATCCVMVDAPRGASRSRIAFFRASFISCEENPSWKKNSLSSLATTARFRFGEIRAYGTGNHATLSLLPASRCDALYMSMNAVVSGFSVRSAPTSGHMIHTRSSHRTIVTPTMMPATRRRRGHGESGSAGSDSSAGVSGARASASAVSDAEGSASGIRGFGSASASVS